MISGIASRTEFMAQEVYVANLAKSLATVATNTKTCPRGGIVLSQLIVDRQRLWSAVVQQPLWLQSPNPPMPAPSKPPRSLTPAPKSATTTCRVECEVLSDTARFCRTPRGSVGHRGVLSDIGRTTNWELLPFRPSALGPRPSAIPVVSCASNPKNKESSPTNQKPLRLSLTANCYPLTTPHPSLKRRIIVPDPKLLLQNDFQDAIVSDLMWHGLYSPDAVVNRIIC